MHATEFQRRTPNRTINFAKDLIHMLNICTPVRQAATTKVSACLRNSKSLFLGLGGFNKSICGFERSVSILKSISINSKIYMISNEDK